MMCEIQSIEIESPILPGVEKIGGYGGNFLGGEKLQHKKFRVCTKI